jgi:tRNA(Ile)-lysidine synthase TilS/MesJ
MVQTCKRCGLDTRIPNITFNEKGECNFCQLYDVWSNDYKPEMLHDIVRKIKKDGKGKEYDCVTGVSGGCDSSRLLLEAKKMGLRPLAVHWDNGWNSDIAKSNMQKITNGLNVDLKVYSCDLREYNDINRSFLYASVKDVDIPNDIALETVLHMAAEEVGVQYILNGHAYQTEGTTPLGWTYMDGKYIESVHKKFGKYPMKTFPNLWLDKWLKWCVVDKIKHIRPLWYIKYNKSETKKMLNKKFGWEWYGGHHKENKYTQFGMYYNFVKFGMDMRLIGNAALVRDGQQTLAQSYEATHEPITMTDAELDEIFKVLDITKEEYSNIFVLEKKTHNDYETYQKTYHELQEFFLALAKLDLVPMTFYLKYAKGI